MKNSSAIVSVLRAAPASLRIMVQRRSQRSTSTPASGDSRRVGKTLNRKTKANCVTEAVRWYTHRPRANSLKPEPTIETNCPIQITVKARIPDGGFGEVIVVFLMMNKKRVRRTDGHGQCGRWPCERNKK